MSIAHAHALNAHAHAYAHAHAHAQGDGLSDWEKPGHKLQKVFFSLLLSGT